MCVSVISLLTMMEGHDFQVLVSVVFLVEAVVCGV